MLGLLPPTTSFLPLSPSHSGERERERESRLSQPPIYHYLYHISSVTGRPLLIFAGTQEKPGWGTGVFRIFQLLLDIRPDHL